MLDGDSCTFDNSEGWGAFLHFRLCRLILSDHGSISIKFELHIILHIFLLCFHTCKLHIGIGICIGTVALTCLVVITLGFSNEFFIVLLVNASLARAVIGDKYLQAFFQ